MLVELRRNKVPLPPQTERRLETIATLAVRMRETVRRLSDEWEAQSEAMTANWLNQRINHPQESRRCRGVRKEVQHPPAKLPWLESQRRRVKRSRNHPERLLARGPRDRSFRRGGREVSCPRCRNQENGKSARSTASSEETFARETRQGLPVMQHHPRAGAKTVFPSSGYFCSPA